MKELKIVAAMSLGFGLVGIDRFLISTLYPVIAKDLHLDYGDIGLITGALAMAWGLAALLMGSLSDRLGHRYVLTLSMVAFSLLIGASGLATGVSLLILVRIVMGFADGAYTPVSIASTLAVSAPHRSGMNIGIQQMMMPLFGLGLSPLFVAFALQYVEWRWVFLLFVIPGLLLAAAVWRVIPPHAHDATAPTSSVAAWREVLRYRNVRVAAALMPCWLTCLISTSAFLPNYLLDHLHLVPGQMGLIMSSIGLGATVGTLTLPALSDKVGRKRVMLFGSAGVFGSLILLSLAQTVLSLFSALFAVHFFNNALIALTVGPLCGESVPKGLMATSSGVVIAIAEFFGGGLAPVVVGRVAKDFGIEHILWMPMVTSVAGFCLCLLIRSKALASNAYKECL